MPSVPDRLLRRLAAARLYTYPRRAAESRTLARVTSATKGLFRITNDTVARETPTSAAMSRRVMFRSRRELSDVTRPPSLRRCALIDVLLDLGWALTHRATTQLPRNVWE